MGRAVAPLRGAPRALSVRVELDAQQLATDEKVVAVPELPLGLQPYIGSVTAIQIGEGKFPSAFLDAAMRARHEEVARKIQIAALAADLQRVGAGTDHHTEHAPLQDLTDTKRARVFGRRIEIGAVLLRPVGGARRDVEAEELLTSEELITGRKLHRSAHAQVHTVERSFVAHDEPPIAIEKVRVLRRDER